MLSHTVHFPFENLYYECTLFVNLYQDNSEHISPSHLFSYSTNSQKALFYKFKGTGSLAQTPLFFIILWFFILFSSASSWFHSFKIDIHDLQELSHTHIVSFSELDSLHREVARCPQSEPQGKFQRDLQKR